MIYRDLDGHMLRKVDVYKILEAISRDEIVDLALKLVKIPSPNPPGEEEAVAEFIASKLSEMGIEASLEEVSPRRPNVIAILKGLTDEPTLIFNGHMDVVPSGAGWTKDPFGAIEGDRIYGRGAADMKGTLASMIIALKNIKKSGVNLKGNIVFHAVVDEEVHGWGTKHLVDKGLKADFALIGEPTDLDICIAHKGNFTFQISTSGRAVHATIPHKGVNAIVKMFKIIEVLNEYEKKIALKVNNPLLGRPTLNIGTIQGGIKSNIVPESCIITVDRRFVPPESLNEVKDEIIQLIEKVKNSDQELKCELKSLVEIDPSEIHGGERGLESLRSSIVEVLGRSSHTRALHATCDAVYLNNIAKIPTVIIGPGRISEAHTADEYVLIDDLVSASKIYALTALKFLS